MALAADWFATRTNASTEDLAAAIAQWTTSQVTAGTERTAERSDRNLHARVWLRRTDYFYPISVDFPADIVAEILAAMHNQTPTKPSAGADVDTAERDTAGLGERVGSDDRASDCDPDRYR